MKKLGPHGALVAEFLDEVRTASRETWIDHVDQPLAPLAAQKEAWRALGEVRLSAAVYAAIGKESQDAFRATGLSAEDFPGKKARYLAISSEIELACTVIAAGDDLANVHARTILAPFAAGGFSAATAELERREGSPRPHDA